VTQPAIKERPILFSSEMVRAILEGRKTQTRRICEVALSRGFYQAYATGAVCPYGQPGDRLWVREAWACIEGEDSEGYIYRADWHERRDRSFLSPDWRPSIRMPRRISRITLEIQSVRVERLHRIGEESARGEGVEPEWVVSVERGTSYQSYCAAFVRLWDKINAKRGYPWESNPWVWVIEFRRVL
jgi:hypothetical protein